MPGSPRVSILVPTKDRPEAVLTLLRMLEGQTRRPDEVVIVDGAATNRLADAVARFPFVRYEWNHPDDGITHAINVGVSKTDGDIVVILDDDLEPPPSFLQTLLRAYELRPEIGGACGVPLPERRIHPARIAFLRIFHLGVFKFPMGRMQDGCHADLLVPVRRFSGCVQSYRRSVLERYRFDENLRGYCLPQDAEFSYRVSREYLLVMVPAARALHHGQSWLNLSMEDRLHAKVVSYAYLFFKGLRREPFAGVAFAWLLVGIFAESLTVALRRKTTTPIEGFAKGIRNVFGSLDGAGGFVRRDPRSFREP